MKRLDFTRLRPGDIILTGGHSKLSLAVRKALGGEISHALLYLQSCSVMDSTIHGVRASNTQRMFFHDDETVVVLHPRSTPTGEQIAELIAYARSQNGTRYDAWGAARSRKGTGPRAGNRQFCSRLVARAYAAAGILLHEEPDYCSPQHLIDSGLLEEVPDPTVSVSDAEVLRWGSQPDSVERMWKAEAKLFRGVRRLDGSIENLDAIVRFVLDHPEKDERVSRLLRQSGYLDVWEFEVKIKPWHRDVSLMFGLPRDEVDDYCRVTLDDEPGGGDRFRQVLASLHQISGRFDRVSIRRLVALYEQLCELHEQRLEAARDWLLLRGGAPAGGAGPAGAIARPAPSVAAN